MVYHEQKIKEVLACIARLPLVLAVLFLTCPVLLFSCSAKWLFWMMCKLQAADLWIVTWAAGFLKVGGEEKVPDRLPALVEIVAALGDYPDSWINDFRMRVEDSSLGRHVRAKSEDHHLYAVLKPTREENLLRVENIFLAMNPKQFEHARHVSKEQLGL